MQSPSDTLRSRIRHTLRFRIRGAYGPSFEYSPPLVEGSDLEAVFLQWHAAMLQIPDEDLPEYWLLEDNLVDDLKWTESGPHFLDALGLDSHMRGRIRQAFGN